MAVFV